ncbi:MAG TPA: hypothetical protein DCM08_03035 [Microscillaceae bacterium]|nr:hypothetical protein [Microscillaceae bacterium]
MTNLTFLHTPPYQFTAENDFGYQVFHYSYTPEKCICAMRWRGFFLAEEIQAIFMEVARFNVEYKLKVVGVLNDMQRVEGSFHDSIEWFLTQFVPQKVVPNGIKFSANVKPKNFYASLSYDEFLEHFETPHYENRLFNTVEEATLWLETMLADQSKAKPV